VGDEPQSGTPDLLDREHHPGLAHAAGVAVVAQRHRPVDGWPLVVIGGILPSRVGECLAAGADSVAMIAGLLDGDPGRNVAAALEAAAQAGFA